VIEVVIAGAGGHGAEIWSYIRDLARSEEAVHCVGFVDEGEPTGAPEGALLGGLTALGDLAAQRAPHPLHYITAVGDNLARRNLVARIEGLGQANLIPWTLIHPAAHVGASVSIGPGCCLAPGSIVTTRVAIGRHAIVNVNASVSHDCSVGDFANINPGAVLAGNVCVEAGAFVGAGATIIERRSVGRGGMVGAGAVVIDDVAAGATAAGVPAREIGRVESSEW
jgi:sugar O-acyltransferase (sialic acid O-acetyltransferase NeuD family)